MPFIDEAHGEETVLHNRNALRRPRPTCCGTHDLDLQEPPAGEQPLHRGNDTWLAAALEQSAPGSGALHDLECADGDLA